MANNIALDGGLGVYGKIPPAAQPTSASQAAVTVTAVTAIATTTPTSSSPKGFTTTTQPKRMFTRINQLVIDVGAINTLITRLRLDLVNAGIIKGS